MRVRKRFGNDEEYLNYYLSNEENHLALNDRLITFVKLKSSIMVVIFIIGGITKVGESVHILKGDTQGQVCGCCGILHSGSVQKITTRNKASKAIVDCPYFKSFNYPREKKSGSFFSKFRQLFRYFFGKFLEISGNFQDFSENFPEKSPPILEGSTRCFSREKKRKSINIIVFPFILEKYLVEFLEISGSRIFY